MSSSDEQDLMAVDRIFERLSMTSNEELSAVLNKLLPKLLPLMNREALRPTIFKILSNVTKRVKLLGTKLPCADMIPLIHSDLKPFASNFAIVMVDIGLMSETESSRVDCAISLLDTLQRSTEPMFSTLENSLVAYSSVLIHELAQVSLARGPISSATHALCDWFLDVALYQTKSAAVSAISGTQNAFIFPGISSRRLERLREKNESPLRLRAGEVKLRLVTHLHDKWIYVR